MFYTIRGLSSNGADYVALPGFIIIPSGLSEQTLTNTPLADSVIEGNETVVLTLMPDTTYEVGVPNSATNVIYDNDLVPGDVNGDVRVTGADSLLISQVLVGLRSNTRPIFAIAGYQNGDVNQTNVVSGADSLLINQVLVGLRAYITTKVLPNTRTNNVPIAVTIYGIGFPTNVLPAVSLGTPVNLTLTNIVVVGHEQITATVPAGGGLGTGMVIVISSPTNGVISFGKFINR